MQIDGMAKKIEGLETMMTFILMQQILDLNDEDIEHMMSHVIGKENSTIAPRSFVFTNVPFFD